MELAFAEVSWWAVLVSIVAGQVISTVWFVVLFGEPWAKEYGVADKKAHTAAIPGYTYGVQALCTAAMVITVALLQRAVGVTSVGDAVVLGLVLAIGLCVATGLPGQAFLKRWRVFAIAFGCQVVMILAASLILALW